MSPGLDAITGVGAYGPTGRLAPTSGPVDAVIATTVASVDEDVHVLTPNAQQRTGPCRWTPRVDSMGTWLMPAEGDPCVIQTSTLGQFTVLWWQPATARAGLLIGEAVGDIKFTARTTWPAWWLLCDARAITVALGYPTLRAALLADGSPYGVFGADPLLPSFGGRAPVGAGGGAGMTTRVVGTKVGEEAHLLTGTESGVNGSGVTGNDAPDHTHSSQASGTVGAFNGTLAIVPKATTMTVDGSLATGGASTRHTHPLVARDASIEHNNMQPSLVLNALIRT